VREIEGHGKRKGHREEGIKNEIKQKEEKKRKECLMKKIHIRGRKDRKWNLCKGKVAKDLQRLSHVWRQ
jgi:hypothetical protein